MLSRRRDAGFLGVTLAAAVWPSGQAAAQFLSPNPFLSPAPNADTLATFRSGANPLGLLSLSRDAGNLLILGIGTGETVRTVRGGEHIGDLYGGARRFFWREGLGRKARLEIFGQESSASGVLQDSRNRFTVGNVQSAEFSTRLRFPFSHQVIGSIGFDRAASRFSALSGVLTQALPLFPGTPDAQWRYRRDAVVLGGRYQSPGWTAEGAISRFRSPGSLTATEGDASLRLPLGTTGSAFRLSLERSVAGNDRTRLFVHVEKSDARGASDAFVQETMPLGGRTTTRVEVRAFEVGLIRRTTERDTLTVFHSRRVSRLATEGFGFRAASLGYSPDDVSRVGYQLHLALDRREYGLKWKRDFPHKQEGTLEYRWIETPFQARYGYIGQQFLFTVAQKGAYDATNARGHRLAAGYVVPLGTTEHAPRLLLDAAQIIPLPLMRKSSGSGNAPSGPPAPARHTRGGWEVNLGIAQPL